MDRPIRRRVAARNAHGVELAAGLLRGVLQEHDREAIAALEAFASANGWRVAA